MLEYSLQGTGASVVAAPGLRSTGSTLVAPRLSCSEACGIFPHPRIKPMSPALAGRLFTTEPPGIRGKGTGAGANFTFVRSNFRYLKNWMRYYGEGNIDGLLADLGVSSHHFDDFGRVLPE